MQRELFSDAGKRAGGTTRDEWYTPAYAAEYLRWLPDGTRIWEPCASKHGLLAKHLRALNDTWTVIESDLSTGQDFFEYAPPADEWDVIVTNPPFKNKNAFFERALSFSKPVVFLCSCAALESNPLKKLIATSASSFSIIMPHRKIHFIPEHLYVADPTRTAWRLRESHSFFQSMWYILNMDPPSSVEDATVMTMLRAARP